MALSPRSTDVKAVPASLAVDQRKWSRVSSGYNLVAVFVAFVPLGGYKKESMAGKAGWKHGFFLIYSKVVS